METIDRIEKLLIDEGVPRRQVRKELAKTCGISVQAVGEWFNGKTKNISHPNLISIVKRYGSNIDYLLTGIMQVKESNAVYYSGIESWDSSTELPKDEVELPFFTEVEAAAGSGQFHVQENHGPKLRFSRATLSRYSIEPENAACIKVKGNSMEPVLPDGSTIGVDLGNKSIIDGKMYAIDHDGMLRVKMLYRLPGGGMRLRSYNIDEHPDEHYNTEESKHIRIIGKVFWSSVLY